MKERIQKALEDKDLAELIKGSGISFLLRFGGLAIGYVLTLIIANLFGAQGLGDYVLAITVLGFFTLLAKIGLDTTSLRFISSFASQNKWSSIFYFRKQIILILFCTSIIASVLMYLLAHPIADLINANHRYIQLNAFFVLPMAFFMLHYQSLRGLKRIAEFSFYYRMSKAFFSIIAIVVIYQFNKGSEVPVYAYLVSLMIVSILSFLSFQYWLKEKSYLKQSTEKEVMTYYMLLKISIPLMLAQSVQYIMAWTDKLILGSMATPEDVGVYFTAFKLSMFAAIALMSINSIASPKFSELFAKDDIQGLEKVVHQSSKMIFWTSVPLIGFCFIFPEFLLGLFGEEFKIGVTAFIFLSCGRLVSSLSGSVGNILQMTGNQNIYGTILLFGAIINVLLNLMLIPETNPLSGFGISGINGAAFASMCSLSLWNISMVLVVRRKFGFYTFYLPFLKR